MVEVAQLALDLVLPAEAANRRSLMQLARDETLLRKIFEAGVAGYLKHHLVREGWTVRAQRLLAWQTSEPSPGILAVLPGMEADIVLEREGRRIVVDTKFTLMLTTGQYGREVLKSGHIYQLYSYLRSQEGKGHGADTAEGLLLYPAVGAEQHEEVVIDGHRLRFSTIDLTAVSSALGHRLKTLVCG
jgi:5-methylcytosine-specific restriction enzyme subunit McrC